MQIIFFVNFMVGIMQYISLKKFFLSILTFLILAIAVFPAARADAAEAYNGWTFEASFGYGPALGYYDAYLSPGISAGVGAFHPVRLFGVPLVAQGEFLFSRYAMRESSASCLDVYSLRGGFLYIRHLYRFFNPYAGALYQESLVRFTADRIGENDAALKPGAVVKAGFLSSFSYGIGSRIGAECGIMPISDRAFGALTVTAAVTFNYAALAGEGSGEKNAIRADIERLMRQAQADIEEKNSTAAKESFRRVLSLDDGHPGAREGLKRIEDAERYHARALSLSAKNQIYDAIALFEQASPVMIESERELSRLRGRLARELPALERRGIALYEKNEYGQCIAVMRKILLVDPENRTAKIYLPRAERRLQAIERLK